MDINLQPSLWFRGLGSIFSSKNQILTNCLHHRRRHRRRRRCCRADFSFPGLSFAAFSPSQTERHSPLLCLRSRPSLDGGKMRASVRMTRYLESWGAAKPFANLHHRDCMTADNGKINTTVSANARAPQQGSGVSG